MATEQERNRGAGAYSTPGVDVKPDTGPSKIITSSPIVSFAFQNLTPPSSLYITRDDRLLIHAFSTITAIETAVLTLRILRPDGVVVANTFTLIFPNADVLVTQLQNLTEGFLLSATAVSTVATQRGQTFMRVYLVRSSGAITNGALGLFADYLTLSHGAVWPGGRFVYPTEGPGNLRVGSANSPLAGNEIVITVPTAIRWRVISMYTLLSTSAAVANRTTRIQVQSGGGFIWQSGNSFLQPASTGVNFSITPGVTFFNDGLPTPNQSILLTFPANLFVHATDVIRTSTLNLQVADQYSAVQLFVEEWLDAL